MLYYIFTYSLTISVRRASVIIFYHSVNSMKYLEVASKMPDNKINGVTSRHWKCSHCVFRHCGASTVGSRHTEHVSHSWPQANYGEAIFILYIAANWNSHTLSPVYL